MKDETRIWISYADENLNVSVLALENGYLNACLQNAQQAVEKYLKAIIIEHDFQFLRTHSISELIRILADKKIHTPISEDALDLMDAIYVPSKYPIYSALPHTMPDKPICDEALSIAKNVKDFVDSFFRSGGDQ